MTDSNVLQCQELSVSIIFMISEMITGSYLCRFDSRGIKSILPSSCICIRQPPFVVQLFGACGIVSSGLSVPLCHTGTSFHPHSSIILHSSYLSRYHRHSSASPFSMLCATHFRHHHLLGLVPPMLIC